MARRYADVDWELPKGEIGTWERVQVAILMDIRAELRALNRVMQCPNVGKGFRALQRIDKRLQKKVPLK